ncbi:uncharacterized protein LOC135393379 [Ornithodoros turicata]|uniref:uncharacterized protein LOC135393379 n=1 Tax=Ornithodoros turicata TaxID=34597 RepID=UPI00313880F1
MLRTESYGRCLLTFHNDHRQTRQVSFHLDSDVVRVQPVKAEMYPTVFSLLLVFGTIYHAAGAKITHHSVPIVNGACKFHGYTIKEGVIMPLIINECALARCNATLQIVFRETCDDPPPNCFSPFGGTYPECCEHYIC